MPYFQDLDTGLPYLQLEIGTGEEETKLCIPDMYSLFYGNNDGISFCGARSYQLSTHKHHYVEWLSLEGADTDVLKIVSYDLFDEEQIKFAHVRVDLDDYNVWRWVRIIIELFCGEDEECGIPADKSVKYPDKLDPTVPEPRCCSETNFDSVGQGQQLEVKNVEFQYYRMFRLQVWHQDGLLTGFVGAFTPFKGSNLWRRQWLRWG